MSVQREAFEDFAGRAEEELGDSLERLVLYGSVARGEENQDSDVDIFAVVESTAQKEFLQNLASSMSVERSVDHTDCEDSRRIPGDAGHYLRKRSHGDR